MDALDPLAAALIAWTTHPGSDLRERMRAALAAAEAHEPLPSTMCENLYAEVQRLKAALAAAQTAEEKQNNDFVGVDFVRCVHAAKRLGHAEGFRAGIAAALAGDDGLIPRGYLPCPSCGFPCPVNPPQPSEEDVALAIAEKINASGEDIDEAARAVLALLRR